MSHQKQDITRATGTSGLIAQFAGTSGLIARVEGTWRLIVRVEGTMGLIVRVEGISGLIVRVEGTSGLIVRVGRWQKPHGQKPQATKTTFQHTQRNRFLIPFKYLQECDRGFPFWLSTKRMFIYFIIKSKIVTTSLQWYSLNSFQLERKRKCVSAHSQTVFGHACQTALSQREQRRKTILGLISPLKINA